MTLEGLFDRALSTHRDQTERAALLDLGPSRRRRLPRPLLRSNADARTCASAARSVDALAAARTWLQERYPVTEPTEETAHPDQLLVARPHGASRSPAKIDVPAWERDQRQLPRRRRVRVSGLMERRRSSRRERPADPLARRAGNREDVRPAGARLGVAEWCDLPLRHRPGERSSAEPEVHARRAAQRDDDEATTAAGGCSSSRTPASCSRRTPSSAPARACRGFSTCRRPDRPGAARPRARHDERAAPQRSIRRSRGRAAARRRLEFPRSPPTRPTPGSRLAAWTETERARTLASLFARAQGRERSSAA